MAYYDASKEWREAAALLQLDPAQLELTVLRLLERKSGYTIRASEVLAEVLTEVLRQVKSR